MLRWLSGSREKEPTVVEPALDLESLEQQEVAVVYKHSRSCATSWVAKREVDAFRANHPAVPVYMLTVQKERDLSNRIAQSTGIRHESPQVIVFRRGTPIASASHGDVTEEYLEDAVFAAPAD